MIGRSVVGALRRELRGMEPEVAGSAQAVAAVALARRLDDPLTPASAVPGTARELREALARLEARSRAELPADRLDELARRRDERRAS